MNKWSELRETIRELHDNNADKPDVVGVTGFLLNLMNVKDRDCDLLKEQEAVEPRRIDGKRNHFIKCGNCNYDLMTGFKFCPHCGRAVKWE